MRSIVRRGPGEGDYPRIQSCGESPSPQPSPRKRGEGARTDRHCERSEAIHGASTKEWIASSRSLSSGAHSRDPLAPRNDGKIRLRIPAARDAPELCMNDAPQENRGRGECRVPAAPAASRAK